MRALLPLLLLFGCSQGEQAAAPASLPPAPPAPTSQPTSAPTKQQLEGDDYESSIPGVLEDGSELYGAALTAATPAVTLAALVSAPDEYVGKTVRAQGVIGKVCKAMGCWLELKDDAGHSIRTPMAAHAYFLPQKVVGKAATIEGRVTLGDGVGIMATGVLVAAR